MSFRIVSRVIKKLCERICVVCSCQCFVVVNQLHSVRREYKGISLASSSTNHTPPPLPYGLSYHRVCVYRLPVVQGPSASYLLPIMSLFSLDEWNCSPATITGRPTSILHITFQWNNKVLATRCNSQRLCPRRKIIDLGTTDSPTTRPGL